MRKSLGASVCKSCSVHLCVKRLCVKAALCKGLSASNLRSVSSVNKLLCVKASVFKSSVYVKLLCVSMLLCKKDALFRHVSV